MLEVTIRLQFNRECLGSVPSKTRSSNTIYRMPRDAQGTVMFLPSWWRGGTRYAAKVLGRYHSEAQEIAWSPLVDGHTSEWQRTVIPAQESKHNRRRYALHEAFLRNDIIGVTAVLPPGLTIDAFIELLNIVGLYKGISPFKSAAETYGTFQVVSVLPAIRSGQAETLPLSREAAKDSHASAHS